MNKKRECYTGFRVGEIGKAFIVTGLLVVVIGLVLSVAPKIPFLGKLPGDVLIKRDGFTLYFPITSSILLSIILSFILWLLGKR